MLRKGLLTSIAVLACAVPAAAQAAPTWLAPGSVPSASFPSVAVNGGGFTSIALATTGGLVAGVLHAPGDAAFAAPLNASTAAGFYPSTSVNAHGDVAVGWDDGSQAWAAIKPAGGSFGTPIDLGPSTSGVSGYNVQVRLADSGDLVAAWEGYESSAIVKHWIVKPAGGPLGPLGSVSTGNSTYGAARLGMNGAGDAVVTWTQYNGTHWIIREVSRPAGGSFGAPVTLSDISQDAVTPYAAVAGNGGAAIAWARSNGTNTIIQLSRRPSTSGDFGLPIDLSPTGVSAFNPVVAANASGELVVVWGRGPDVQGRIGSLTDAFDPTVDFEPFNSPAQAAISDSGEAIVTWGGNNMIRASMRAPGGAFRAPFDLSTGPVTYYGNVPAAPVSADAAGDIVTAWMQNSFSDVGYRVFDATGPRLDGLTVPESATAGAAASFSVAPLDAFSAVASTHWDFGDGASADGASVSHAFGAAGTYTVKVTATDAVGNATSATNTINVSSAPVSPTPPTPPPVPPAPKVVCKVPNLKGLTVAKAKKKLTAAHCKLGTVLPKKLQKSKSAVITKQSRKAGTTTSANAKVNVTLGKKPKAKRR